MNERFLFKRKKGQVTIFIILAIVIVVIGILIYAFFPKIKSSMGLETRNPYTYIQSCLHDKLNTIITNLSLQGGSISPQGSYLYLGNNVKYLCYTNQYYKLCKVQEPFIKEHVEKEITKAITGPAQNCFDSLTENYRKRGYGVSLKNGIIKTDILPGKTLVSLNYQLELKKNSIKDYDKFNIVLNNNLYQMLGVVRSIIEWETTLGAAVPMKYMMLYPRLLVEKKKQSDGTKIYILTEDKTGEIFQFASRSLAFPPGYYPGKTLR